jgi:serine/threonine protein kinase
MIGKGTFGRVFQVRKKDTKRIYAMKVLSKREIVAKKEVAHTIGERKILQRSSDSPFLLGLKFSFQSETDLYLVMDYKSGGELFHHLQKEGRFTEDRARFYTAEIVLAFEHLHNFDIVYRSVPFSASRRATTDEMGRRRDLKPENILLDATGHIVLCDFGLSKPDLPSDGLTNTFCGTTEYLAPEILLDDHGYSKLVDFWCVSPLRLPVELRADDNWIGRWVCCCLRCAVDGVRSMQRIRSRCTNSCEKPRPPLVDSQCSTDALFPQLLREGQVPSRCHRGRRETIRQRSESRLVSSPLPH